MNFHFKSWPPTSEEIQQLIDSAVPEGPTLDFKREFIKPEKFRERVCAFANASGGEFVFGIEEKDGVASKITPITLDKELDRKEIDIREIIRSGIYPQIPGVKVVILPITTEHQTGHVAVVRIPKSWVGPHMVIEKKQIYIRESTQSRPMEYHEMRQAFLGTEEQSSRLRQFRKERCDAIFNRDTPIQMELKRCIVTHVMPLDTLSGGRRFAASTLQEAMKSSSPPLGRNSSKHTHVDATGVFQKLTLGTKPFYGMTYIHVFYSGIIETVNCQSLRSSFNQNPPSRPEIGKIPHGMVDQECANAVKESTGILNRIGVEPPFVVFLSLLDIQNTTSDIWDYPEPCNYKPHILAHEFALDHNPQTFEETARAIKPALDNLANGFGMAVSPSFKTDGTWQMGKSF